jgi:TP901 family phage tail tape measure protein
MPEQNFTTKYKVDISDLKKGISDANKSIKLANAEFKNATAGLDDWSKSADGLTAKIKQQNSIVDAEKKKLDLLKEQLDRLNKAQKDGQQAVDDLTDKYNKAVKEYGAASEEAKKYAKQLSEAEAAQERNAAAAEDLNIKIINQDTAVKNAAAQVGKYETALEQLTNGENDAADASGKLDKSVGDVDKSTQDTVNGGLNAFGVALGNLASNLITAAINKLGELGKAVKDAFVGFDEGADNVIKATGATGDAAKDLTKSYANVSKSVLGDFADIGDTLGEVNTRFDFTGDKLEETTKQFIKFADITGSDAKKAVQDVSKAMANAGINSDEYAEILDYLASAAQSSGVSVDKLAEGLTKNGAPMRALGFDTKETIAMFAQWEKAGVNTETAFAGMKKAVANWTKEGKDAKSEFQTVLDQIAAAPDITAATQKAVEEFGTKAGPELADAIKTGRFEYSDFVSLLESSQGTVNATYEETQDGADKAKLAIQNMKTSAAELVGNLLDKYGPQIEKAIGKITSTFEKIVPQIEKGIAWIEDNLPEIEAGVVGIAAAFAAWKVTGIITAVTTALAGMSAAEVVAAAKTWLLNAAMAANPIGLVVAAIAALVAAFVVLWKKSEKFREFWKGLWEGIKKAVQPVIDFIVDIFSKAWERIKAVWAVVSTFFKTIFNGIKKIFAPIADWFKDKFGTAVAIIKAVFSTVVEVFQKVHDKIQEIFGPIVDWFKEKFETAVAIIKLVFGAIVDFFQGIWDGIKAIFEPVIDWFKEKFETAWLVIKLVWEAVTDFFSGIWEGIKNVFGGVVDWFKEKFETAWLTIKFIWEAVTDFFSGIWEGVKNVFSTVGQFFKDAFQKAWDNIKAVFNGITDFFKGIWDKITGVFKSVGTKIADAFTGAFKKVVNGVFEFIEDKINGFIDMINGVIHLINNIPGVDLGDIGHVNLPRLEKGGILKKGQVGLLEGTGAEAVVPLESDTDGLKKIAGILAKEMQSSNVVYNNNSGDTVTNYNFTQNNSSPKALSRYDIYRQTRNLINAAKGV